MTRARGLFAFALILALASIAVTLVVGKWGRDQQTVTLRAGCLRSGQRNVKYVDATRADVVGNLAVADDPRQPPRTRHARRHEAAVEAITIAFYDRSTDASLFRVARYQVDRDAILAGGFSCAKAYPPSGLIP